MGAVDPAVPTPARVIDHRVGVVGAQAGIELFNLIALAVPIGVAQPKDIGRLGDNDPVLVKNQTGNQIESFVKHCFLIHHPVAIAVRQPRNLVLGFALLCARGRIKSAVVFPFFAAVIRSHPAFAVGIFRGLRDPQCPVWRPVEIHGLADEGFGGDQGEREVRVHFERFEGVGGSLWATLGIGQRGEFLGFAEFIGIGAFTGPGD